MIGLEQVYWLTGALFAALAILALGEAGNAKRFGTASFWALLSISFLFGSYIGDAANGALVLALAVLGGLGALGPSTARTTTPAEREARAIQRGNAIFLPALLIPAIAIAGTFTLGKMSFHGTTLADPKQVTLIALALGIVVALAVSMVWLRPPLLAPLREAGRLAGSIGWAMVLPQMLAALGAVFALAGAGDSVGALASQYLPLGSPLAAVAAYCLGMALFTAVMGNAFAAFPVMTAALGMPLIVHKFGGNPAIMASIGMLSGFCGTLTTPMAANFNIVPAALLELGDRNAVIKAQIPTALMLLAGNIILMQILVFRF